jgi:hypothetical protein
MPNVFVARHVVALTLVGCVVGATLLTARAEHGTRELDAPRYGRDIRPILSDRCFTCHGPDAEKRMAGLQLDTFEGATAAREGGAAIVPGDLGASELWRRITSDDDDVRMPPPSSTKKALTDAEREAIARWIEAGAVYEPHWAFEAPVRPMVPEVRDEQWARGAIDRFVLARLEAEGLAPSADASDELLVRRVFQDLTGLPPTPEELAAYAADARADRYERLVDRLLTEEPYVSRYAERMALPWLDASRYADTSGIHMDAGRSMWPWRDWVLAAYRENMPFDRFVTEQLAGDLIPNATQAQIVASGFNRNHVTSDEGGAIDEEYLVEYSVDRTATTGSVFLGLTLGCARCHDHKFDPIGQGDFFNLYAYFASIDEPGIYTQEQNAQRALEPYMAVPSEAQLARRAALDADLSSARAALAVPDPEEAAQFDAFLGEYARDAGVVWADARLEGALSTGGATITREADGSALVSGANPDRDEHVFTLRTDARDLRLVSIEALVDARLPEGRVGRAPNGNAVLTGVVAEAISIVDPTQRRSLNFEWAWADVEQSGGDFRAVNMLDARDERGWAVGAHQTEGPRVALLLADEPFGFDGGTQVVVRLQYQSVYDQHALGRVRVGFASIADAALERLPLASSGWFTTGNFEAGRSALFDTVFGPENATDIDPAAEFDGRRWSFAEQYADEALNELPGGQYAAYVAKDFFAPSARKLDVSLGSDDGLRIFLGGREVFANQIDRGLTADADQAAFDVPRGRHTVVFKIVNTGGQGGFYWREVLRPNELDRDLVAALLPRGLVSGEEGSGPRSERLLAAWRKRFSPSHTAALARVTELEAERSALEASIPRTMVMKELDERRATYVLMRGAYDAPDETRPARRGVPAALGMLPEGAPDDRLGLAQWLVGAENPLVARVAVNRLWEQFFGLGIVGTSEDFGLQGEYPTHPELLDWLAVDFRESGWDTKRLVKLVVTSSTYRQSSRVRPELLEIDPDNRLLAYFPRLRLPGELIRDQALYVSGLLVEQLGGPSVKPYQPEGLWQEVAMPSSNTREYERGMGADLWRRSVYTYWKRAAPPPSMLTFDAPTREFCTIRRNATSTPLQALVLWNDEQFVEAARVLAQRTLSETGDDRTRLARMFERCASRAPDAQELELLAQALDDFRERFAAAPDDARLLIEVGDAPTAMHLAPAELAAWTMLASTVLNLDATISRS